MIELHKSHELNTIGSDGHFEKHEATFYVDVGAIIAIYSTDRGGSTLMLIYGHTIYDVDEAPETVRELVKADRR